ncbi:MAG: TIGR03905 family TSCPD domain-containing protein [Clostridia bacterium]|nr:TIGR03905 family TSCPD domain-containing protein [Clostridia bacterium]
MSKTSVYYPEGVCSRRYEITVSDDGILEDIQIEGGCNGNLKGLRLLMLGRPAKDVADMLEGVHCGPRETSCPDQISRAIREML